MSLVSQMFEITASNPEFQDAFEEGMREALDNAPNAAAPTDNP